MSFLTSPGMLPKFHDPNRSCQASLVQVFMTIMLFLRLYVVFCSLLDVFTEIGGRLFRVFPRLIEGAVCLLIL